ncbi:hypothetical protein [Streptomyces sp. ME19-01-6]|uniref:hypothetical protein n=1 Tax=Streptomyces sp. ME19-01-6 TaxID=3028686 RepID=UPI0029A623B7|nr:hypothetical protein [Streptomyces sp. ME19-01-6]MDX3224873.1 hypothetical protein [Streptomyces sp. ME19-01-6]
MFWYIQLADLTVTHLRKEFLSCDFHRGVLARGCAHAPIRGLRLWNCRFRSVAESDTVEHVEGLGQERVAGTHGR